MREYHTFFRVLDEEMSEIIRPSVYFLGVCRKTRGLRRYQKLPTYIFFKVCHKSIFYDISKIQENYIICSEIVRQHEERQHEESSEIVGQCEERQHDESSEIQSENDERHKCFG